MAIVSFDLDGVLQRNPFRYKSEDGVFGQIRRTLAPYVAQGMGLDSRAEWEAVQQQIDREHFRRSEAGDMVGAHDWDGIVATVAQKLGYPGAISVRELVEHCCKVDGLISLYDGSAECLDAVRARGYTVVALTNGFEIYQAPVLRELGVLDRFETMLAPDNTGYGKPHKGIFDAALRHGSPPAVHIGDTLAHDIAGARRAGWKAVYIDRSVPEEYHRLPPWERPLASIDYLRQEYTRQGNWHSHPPSVLEECIPDAIVVHLREVPDTCAHLLGQ